MTQNPNTVTLGLVQMRCTPEPARNMAAAVQGVREAAARGAQIVCLQELFRSQYFCQTEDHRCFELGGVLDWRHRDQGYPWGSNDLMAHNGFRRAP